ncbi:MAG TPA: hypothetical protein PLL54_05425 [Dermatophilaceae bacterium]|nr:hypothetical protein [Dermatophilaceae bacterium]
MRWDRLFADLEAQLASDAQAALAGEIADRTRRERALVGLHDRLLAVTGRSDIAVCIAGLGVVQGSVADVGADWLLLRKAPDRDHLVPFAAVVWAHGLSGRITPPSVVARSFGVGAALRALSRDRVVVTVAAVDGSRHTGTIDAVGADAIDLAVHAADVPRRQQHVIDVRTMPFTAICAVIRG